MKQISFHSQRRLYLNFFYRVLSMKNYFDIKIQYEIKSILMMIIINLYILQIYNLSIVFLLNMLQDYFGFQLNRGHPKGIPRTERSKKSQSKVKSIPRTERKSQEYSIIRKLQKPQDQSNFTGRVLKLSIKSKSQKQLTLNRKHSLHQAKRSFIFQKSRRQSGMNILNELLPEKKQKKVKFKTKNLFKLKGRLQKIHENQNNRKKTEPSQSQYQQQNTNQMMLLSSVKNYPLQLKSPEYLKKISNKQNSEEIQNPYGLTKFLKKQSEKQSQKLYLKQDIMVQVKPFLNENQHSIPSMQSHINQLKTTTNSLIDALQDQIRTVQDQEQISELYLSSRMKKPKYSISIDNQNSIFEQYVNPSNMYKSKIHSKRKSNYQRLLDEYENSISSISAKKQFQKEPVFQESSVREVKGKIVFVRQQKENVSQYFGIDSKSLFSIQYPNSMLQLLRKDSEQVPVLMMRIIQNYIERLEQILLYIRQSQQIYEDKSLQDCQLQNFLLYKFYHHQRQKIILSLQIPNNYWVFVLPNAEISKDLFIKSKNHPFVMSLISAIERENQVVRFNINNYKNALKTPYIDEKDINSDNFTQKDKKLLIHQLHQEYLILNSNLESSQRQQEENSMALVIHTRLFHLMQLIILINYLQNKRVGALDCKQPSYIEEFEAYQNHNEPIIKQIFLDYI